MAIFSVYVVNKAGGLIHWLDSYAPRAEAEKTSSHPLDLLLKLHDERVLAAFGQHDSIWVGHSGGHQWHGRERNGKFTADGKEMLETDSCKLHCFQTLTGIKFAVLANPRQAGIDSLLQKIYEIYSDFALKNPFYSLEMPIRCELFDQNLELALEVAEKAGTFGPGS
ncbi:trafficking protein particle complex subunit 4-like isoform X3 [Vulpes lagopus]|uniref:trafficking protein particle complex subunit 4-like isoform X3 n=1 Tax=Vulpes lagopus TaxID=494514 RepID=UPI001BC9F283|nr:trafficking protein particle complex subunit 4-like isoform X3 [Vulpes lagopus]